MSGKPVVPGKIHIIEFGKSVYYGRQLLSMHIHFFSVSMQIARENANSIIIQDTTCVCQARYWTRMASELILFLITKPLWEVPLIMCYIYHLTVFQLGFPGIRKRKRRLNIYLIYCLLLTPHYNTDFEEKHCGKRQPFIFKNLHSCHPLLTTQVCYEIGFGYLIKLKLYYYSVVNIIR